MKDISDGSGRGRRLSFISSFISIKTSSSRGVGVDGVVAAVVDVVVAVADVDMTIDNQGNVQKVQKVKVDVASYIKYFEQEVKR